MQHRSFALLATSLLIACGSAPDDPDDAAGTGGSTSVGGTAGMDAGGAGGAGGAAGTGGGAGAAPKCDLPSVTPVPGLVSTDHGPVRGSLDGSAWSYRGIPYAKPPTGELRFRPPVAPDCWQEELQAAEFGNKCPQNVQGGVEGDEDCLTLNVWTPAEAPTKPLPVLVFIHGGGNSNGASSGGGEDEPLFDGAAVVEKQSVLFVSLNYRLGFLGFLAHPALSAEDAHGSSGNYGLLDQIAALQWVQNNIASFGGDPERVMLFGQSAGAFDTCALVASPLAKGLFSRALMQSGICAATPLSEKEARGQQTAETLSCSEASCLRDLDVEELLAVQPPLFDLLKEGAGKLATPEDIPFGPGIDGWVLPTAPFDAIQSGTHNDVPFIIGSTRDETSIVVSPLTPTAYEEKVHDRFGVAGGDLVLASYSPKTYGSARQALIALSTDLVFTCPVRRIASAMQKSQQSPVRRYYFSHELGSALFSSVGAFHALDLYFLFQHAGITSYSFDAAEVHLSEQMLGYWASFAETGVPSGEVAWPESAGADQYLVLDTPIVAAAGLESVKCDLLESLGE